MSISTAIETLELKAASVLDAYDVPITPPPGVEGTAQTILGWMKWGGLIATVAGFIIAGIMLAISNDRGMGNENVKKLGMVCIGGIVISAAGLLGSALVS